MSGAASGRPALRAWTGTYAVCRLPPGAAVEAPAEGFFSVTRTASEVSVVCAEASVPAGARAEPGWRLIEVEGPLDFGQIGVLASLASPLAAASVSIFVLSTFDTDYLLVKREKWAAAREALDGAGFRFV